MSYRINVNEIDRSQTVIPNINNVGAMVVRSERGPNEPVFISARQRQRILDLFGEPEVSYPDVIEALEFNQVAPLWMVSPTDVVNDKLGGLLVKANMEENFPEESPFTGITKSEAETFAFADSDEYFLLHTKFPCAEDFLRARVQYSDLTDSFSIDLQIKREGAYENYESYVVSLNEGAVGDFGVNIYIEDVFEDNDLIGVIVNPNASIEGNEVTVEGELLGIGDDSTTEFEINLANSRILEGSIKIYVNSVLAAQEDPNEPGAIIGEEGWEHLDGSIIYFSGELDLDFSTVPVPDGIEITIDYDYVDGGGFFEVNEFLMFSGSEKTTNMDPFLVSSWNNFRNKNKYPSKIFMDVSADEAIPAIFNELRNSYQKYSSYILPLPLANNWNTAIETKNEYSINNRGLKFYWNHGLVRFGRQRFFSPLTGRVGRKYAQMVNVFNGLAPAWADENDHGGQLGPGILEMRYDPTEDQLRLLDESGVNAISFNANFGVMIMGQKTAKSPGFISDDSYIGHSRLFDTIIENIVEQVLTAQITKLNDEVHRRRAFILTDTFMRPMVDPSIGLLNDYRVKCDTSNNDAVARSQRKFVLSLAVQVTPFSEFIEFNFIKAGQTVSVDSVLT